VTETKEPAFGRNILILLGATVVLGAGAVGLASYAMKKK